MKRKSMFSLLAGLLITSISVAQQPSDDPVIMTVNKQPVLRSEFEAIYKKNNKDASITREALDEYMVLFTNFKLKVTEAEELGMDTIQKFKDELEGYRKQLARPYLFDTEMNEKLLEEAYERMKTDVKASHILVMVDEDVDPKDTLTAYKKAIALRDKALKKGSFEGLASAKEMEKDAPFRVVIENLGYFTSLQMIYSFETAAYNAKIGELSMPVRTRFGYHIIKVEDKRPARGTIKVAHILISSRKEDAKDARDNARKKAEELLQKIQAGEDFSTLARQFSDDQSSSRKGGELPPFGPGRMVEAFEDASFGLQKDGDISGIVETDYGFHIIKRIEKTDLGSFEDMKGNLKQRIARDSRSQLPREAFVEKLKKKYSFKEFPNTVKPYYSVVDTTIFRGKWDPAKAEKLNKPIFEFAGKSVNQTEFTEFLKNSQKAMKQEDVSLFVNRAYDRFVSQKLLDYEDSRLEEQYKEFRMLMKEYRDGILLFELTDQKVWSKAVKDSAGLAQFYEANKNNYLWPKRYKVDIYTVKDAKMAKSLRKDVKKGKLDEKALLEKYNKDSQLNLKVESGTFSVDDKEIIKANTPAAEGLSADIPKDGQVVIINTKKIIEPAPKTLNEAKGLITADYQNYLEQEWLKSLKGKYEVKVNKDVLYSIK